MPRDRDFQVAPRQVTITASGLIASASRKDLKRNGPAKIHKEGWQQRCWYFYDTIGEYYYAVSWVGNLLSRAKLTVNKNGKAVKSGPAFDALQSLFGNPLAQAEMLRQLGVHLSVAGEGYLIGESKGSDPDKWQVVSNLRVSQTGEDQWTVNNEPLSNPLVCRIWRPHPVDSKQATSSSRPVIPILAELEGLTKGVAADIDSRLIGAGLLLMPNEVQFPSMPITTEGEGVSEVRTGADGVQDMLIQAASIAISDQESQTAKVPLVMMMPGERIGDVRHLTFWSDFDAETANLRREAIRRLALGLDMPPEALEGTGDMNHWNAWQLEEAAIKVHTEPLLQLITSALTTGYLWPYLEGDMDEEEARQYSIGSDTTELRLRPNRSKESIELYDRGALKLEVMLRENGFDPDEDQMDGKELQEWFMRKVASGSTTPDLVAEALQGLKVPLKAVGAAPPETQEARPTPTTRQHPTRDIPNDGVPPELIAAGEVLVYRALERAGNKLKNKMRGAKAHEGTPAAELYRHIPFGIDEIDDLLRDAWGACELFSMGFCQEKLDEYARTLLATRQPHNRELLASYLDPVVFA